MSESIENKKSFFKKTLFKKVGFICMLLVFCFLYLFGLERNKKRNISKPEIEFIGENTLFITEDSVNKLLIENFGSRKTITKENLVLNKLESVLTSHPIIESAEVSVTTDGKLKAQVKQRTPVARIYDQESSYYIDYQGKIMPLSNNYSARVPLVSARLKPESKENLIEVLRYIYNDEFLKKNIISIEMKEDKSMLMKNRNYDFTIDFGTSSQMDRKFNNYKAFFQKASQDSLIEKYGVINLQFTRQVVCTKK